jgi:hypothetical protein
VETADMAERIDAIERALKQRKDNPPCGTSWPASADRSAAPATAR